ncbi:MAG TPA: hypothetical protein VJX73_14415 [Terracidiphilus sp.]|nr:hypothetical protein [Terracidiphilus sp.]
MDPPEVAVARYAAKISLWALGLSAGSLLVAGGAFALELRRWFDEGVKLSMSVITVANRGTAATTITHMALHNYPDRLSHFLSKLPGVPFRWPRFVRRWRKKHGPQTFIVNTVRMPLPHVLEPGRNWHGMAVHTPEVEKMIGDGRLFVGVIGSHSGKILFRRVRRWTPPKDAKTA